MAPLNRNPTGADRSGRTAGIGLALFGGLLLLGMAVFILPCIRPIYATFGSHHLGVFFHRDARPWFTFRTGHIGPFTGMPGGRPMDVEFWSVYLGQASWMVGVQTDSPPSGHGQGARRHVLKP